MSRYSYKMATHSKEQEHGIIEAYSKPSAKKLQRHVIPHVATKWYELGLELLDEKEEHELNNINSNYGSDVKRCCLKMFLLWLNVNSDANWWQIVEALKSPGVELSAIAVDLERKLAVEHPVILPAADQTMIESCDSENLNFAEFEDVSLAFSTLLSRLQKEIKIKDFVVIRNACVARASHKLSEQIKKTQDIDSLFQLFADNKAYCNWMNIRFLEVIASASGNSKLVKLVKNYKGVIYSKTLREVWDCIPYHTVRTKYYSRLQVKFDGKDPDNVTIEQLMRFCDPYVVKDIAMLIAIIEEGSLKVTWYIPSDEVRNFYLAALILPQESRLDSYLQIGDWIVHHPLLVLQNLHKEHPTISPSTLLIGYYHGLLLKHIDANFLISKMRSNDLLTSYEEELILTGHSCHQRNWLLLEHVRRMQTQTLMVFCEFMQKIAPIVGLQLVTALQSHVTTEPLPYPGSAVSVSSGVKTVNHPSSLHILFLQVVNQIEELLQLCDLHLLTEACKSLLASEIHGINLFSTTCIKMLVKYNNAVTILRYLSFLFTWSNHSILRALVNFTGKAVQLLDEFDSLLDPLNIIVSYPIPSFSQDMIPSETSEYTLLAIRCNRELWRCSLQYVFSLQSFIVEKCDITQHCLQLLAVKSDPTEFYWTIPKCVVKLIKSNVLQHSEYLYSQGIIEVLVYPKQSLATGDDVVMESLAFTIEKEEGAKELLKDHLKPVYKSRIRTPPGTPYVMKGKRASQVSRLLSSIPEDYSKHEDTPGSKPVSSFYNTSTHQLQEQLSIPDEEKITHSEPMAYRDLPVPFFEHTLSLESGYFVRSYKGNIKFKVSRKAEQIISRFEEMRMDTEETVHLQSPSPVEQREEEDIIHCPIPDISQPNLPPMIMVQRQFSEFPLDQSVLTLGQDGYYLEDRDYNIVRYAGAGGSASCYLGNDKMKSSQFIIKRAKKLYSEKEKQCMMRESRILQEIGHDNVIRFYGAVEDLDYCFKMFLEYPDETCGNIHYLFCESEDKKSLSGNIALIMLYVQQILSALEYLHRITHILHLDIKGKNVIVCNGGYRVKLIDFGTACKANSVPLTLRWTPVFAAPEINNQLQPPKFSADIWSVMCVAVEMVTENLPWPRETNYQTAIYKIGYYEDDQITKLVQYDDYWNKYWHYQKHHDMYKELVCMWKVVFCKDSSSRPSANYLLNLKWMKEMEIHGESILHELDSGEEKSNVEQSCSMENENVGIQTRRRRTKSLGDIGSSRSKPIDETGRQESSTCARQSKLSQEHSRVHKRSNSTPTPLKSCQASKATQYIRDIMCLPKSWCTKPQIPIPRGLRRNYLDEKGLLGKIAFTSTMTSKDVILEVSRVFSSPIGLSKTEIEDEGKRFNFLFLQQGGAGSHTLCRPTVADSFEWNGKHIGSLAKSGGIIYIQALDTLPFIQEDNCENDDSNTDLPPATSFNSSTPLDCDERDNDDIVENTNTTDDATIVVDHHSELVSSSIPTSSNSPCHESSNASVNSFSVSHIGERSPDNFNLQASGSAHHIASTGQSDNNNESGIAPDAKYGSSSIDSNPLDHLLTLFHATLSKKQISAIFDLACHDFDKTMECLLSGPDLNNILKLMSKVSKTYPVVKVRIDQDEIWSDLVSFYKTPNEDISKCRIRICLNDQPAIDTGGIRCQVYTSVLQQFSENQHPFKLFDGPPNSLRPYYSAATRSSGIFKILGSIVGHSIFQDGIGFPHLSTVSYWYIAAGEQAALQYLSLDDVGADCCNFICQLNKAESNQEVTAACNSEGAAELLSRVGVTHITTMANKDVVAQFVMQHEGLYKISVLLDQFKEGLRRVNIENLIESYPNEFAPLFVFSGEIRAMDVIQALYMGKDRTDPVSMGLLQQYISSLSQQELKDFMVCVTGSLVTKERSILVTFDTDANGVIAIHTCTNEISLPFGTFQETDFEHFKSSMDAIIKGSDKLTYNTV